MKKLTRKEALELTIVLWTWLAENPECEKDEYPDFDEFAKLEGECALCEKYWKAGEDTLDGAISCEGCPLDEADNNNCYNNGSDFDLWCKSEYPEVRAEFAWGIVDECKSTLEKEYK